MLKIMTLCIVSWVFPLGAGLGELQPCTLPGTGPGGWQASRFSQQKLLLPRLLLKNNLSAKLRAGCLCRIREVILSFAGLPWSLLLASCLSPTTPGESSKSTRDEGNGDTLLSHHGGQLRTNYKCRLWIWIRRKRNATISCF